jgi:hypothetical protein
VPGQFRVLAKFSVDPGEHVDFSLESRQVPVLECKATELRSKSRTRRPVRVLMNLIVSAEYAIVMASYGYTGRALL